MYFWLSSEHERNTGRPINFFFLLLLISSLGGKEDAPPNKTILL